MANYCSNRLRISGDPVRIAELAARIIRPDPKRPSEMLFDFDGILPVPEGLGDVLPCNRYETGWAQLDDGVLVKNTEETIGPVLYGRLKEESVARQFDWNTLTVGHINRYLQDKPELQKRLGLKPEAAKQVLLNVGRYGEPDCWTWRLHRRGCLWDAQDCQVEVSDGLIDVFFYTDWSPPEGVYAAVCAAYPDLTLRAEYLEENEAVAGSFANSGTTLSDYPCSDEAYRAFAAEHFGCEVLDDDEDNTDD